ncbi:hypothetical protein KY363_06880 [Candidatus Woesearchaeota archaeon]|nr:hypothetical protein [Candidatus Woesearchaeota archaeon]
MINRTKQMLITAEILGFFLIVVGLLGIITNRKIFLTLFFVLFFLIICVVALFVTFLTLAVKEHRAGRHKNK